MGRAPLPRAAALGLCLLVTVGSSRAVALVPAGPRLALRPGPGLGGLQVSWRSPGEAVGEQGWRLRLLDASGWTEAERGSGPPPATIAVPPGATAVELVWEGEGEQGRLRAAALWRVAAAPPEPIPSAVASATVSPPPEAATPTRRVPPAPGGPASPQSGGVTGRLLYRDRAFDLTGYLSTARRLPVRRAVVELRRASDDSLLVAGTTGDDGTFALIAVLPAATSARVVAVSRARGPGLDVQVVDAVGPGGDTSASVCNEVVVATLPSLDPDAVQPLGDLLLHDATGSSPVQAFNLLDTALDALELLADPAFLGALPDSGSVPPITWAPAATYATTAFTGAAFSVVSPGAGDTDGWSDALLLRAMGDWVLATWGRVDQSGIPTLLDGEADARLAYGEGSALVFAAAVRAHRAAARQTVDGDPVDGAVAQVVDLGFPPPLGFTASAQAAVDLETRALAGGDTVLARGQLSVLNVAAMLWDLADGAATADGTAGDDDAVDETGARWFALATAGMAALPAAEPLSFEDVYAAWLALYGDAPALAALAVAQGGTALAADAAEPDGDPASAPVLEPWVQPGLGIGGKVVLGELALGDRDAVELTNRGVSTVDLSGWSVVTRRNGFGTGSQLTATLPPNTALHPGRSLVLHEAGDPSANGATDLYFPAWSIPWRERDDGACTLRNASAVAVDFVRWAGSDGADPSQEPVPAGQTFTGVLVSPPQGYALARDSLATDSDQAADFTPSRPTLRLPNLRALAVRRLYPRGDVDHVRIPVPAGALVQLHAERPVDDARPLLAQLDAAGGVVVEAGAINGFERGAVLQLYSPQAATVTVRLRQDPAALTAAGLSLLAWRPAYAASLLAPLQPAARSRKVDPSQDLVDVTWINSGSYDSVRVAADGVLELRLPGTATATTLSLEAGHHVVTVRPVTGGLAGSAAVTGVFVGPTPCALQLTLDGPDVPQVLQEVTLAGFFLVPYGFDGPLGFRDADFGSATYAPSTDASLTLNTPIDLTSDSRVRFAHAAHLADDGDVARVEVSLDDGVSWLVVGSFRGSDHVGQAGDPANWSDGMLTPDDWVQQEVALGAYAGQRVRLRFRRLSDAAGQSFGWTLDDISFGAPATNGVQWIAPEGDDRFGCGHPERAWRTVGAAVGVAALGDTVAFTAGTFNAPTPVTLDGAATQALLPLPAGIHVRGSGRGVTFLDGSAAPWAILAGPSTGITAAASTATMAELTVQGAGVGARIDSCSVRLRDVEWRHCATGIRVTGGRATLEAPVVGEGGVGALLEDGVLDVRRGTFASLDSAIVARAPADSLRLDHSLMAFGAAPLLTVPGNTTAVALQCNDLFSAHGLTAGAGVSDSLALAAGVSLDPWFCDGPAGDFRLAGDSPLVDLPGCGPVGALGVGCAVATDAPQDAIPARTWLPPNVPNPFNPRTRIYLELAAAGPARVQLLDVRGRLVRSLHAGPLPAGRSALDWDGCDQSGRAVASGVYRVRVDVGTTVLVRPIVLIR